MNTFKTVNIKGKQYVMVTERMKYFREKFRGWSLISEVVELTDKRVVIKATAYDDKDRPRATGLACENSDSSLMNQTSFVEICETSAWGRCLANLSIGIDASIASALEMQAALRNQKDDGSPITKRAI